MACFHEMQYNTSRTVKKNPHRKVRNLDIVRGFPDASDDKESACSAGDPGSIPGSGIPGEGNGYPPQYSCLENSMGSQRVGYDWGLTLSLQFINCYIEVRKLYMCVGVCVCN